MLIGSESVINKSCAFFSSATSTAGAYAGKTNSNWKCLSVLKSKQINMPFTSSFGEGYDLSNALIHPISSEGLGSQTQIVGEAEITASALSVRLSTADLTGTGNISDADLTLLLQGAASIYATGSITSATLLATSAAAATILSTGNISNADLSALVSMNSSIAGTSTVTPELKGKGSLVASIIIGDTTELTAADIWNYDISSIILAGTAGKILNDAGSGANPWSALLASNNTDDTFGAFVQKLLTVNKFIGLK